MFTVVHVSSNEHCRIRLLTETVIETQRQNMDTGAAVYIVIKKLRNIFTVTPRFSPIWFTSMRTLTSHIVTHIISSTVTARGVTVTAVVIGFTNYE